jgi:dTMP kinase
MNLNSSTKAQWVAFEGIDGCGKSTQLSLFQEHLKSQNIPYICVRDPGGTILSEEVREILLKVRQDDSALCPASELLLYNASRAQLIQEKIKPALDAGIWVLSDRFAWSTYAYQGFGRGLALDLIQKAVEVATNGLQPDISFYLDISSEVSVERRAARGGEPDRLELEKVEFFEKVRMGYLWVCQNFKSVHLVDGVQSPELVSEAVLSKFELMIANQ